MKGGGSPVVYSLNDRENAKFFRYLDFASEVAEKRRFSNGSAVRRSSKPTYTVVLSIIYLSRVLCLSVCVSQFVAERSAIL
jgi:hypothetical protein